MAPSFTPPLPTMAAFHPPTTHSNSLIKIFTSNEAEVVSRLELLFAEMKKEVDNDNLIEAKRIELELEKIMEEEGYNFSTKQK